MLYMKLRLLVGRLIQHGLVTAGESCGVAEPVRLRAALPSGLHLETLAITRTN